jgi:hypothetical protein
MSEPFDYGFGPRPTSNDPEILADEIERLLDGWGHVSFVELANWLGESFRGNGRITSARDPNIVFWQGLAEPVVEALNRLIREGRLEIKASSLLVYTFDGGSLRLPIAKRPPREGYRKPHWLPVVLRLTP